MISINEFLLIVYFAGFFIALVHSIRALINIQRLKSHSDIDLFTIKPDIKLYFILKPILWPYFFVTEKSPSERLSELFFKNYGADGVTYFGNQGLKNFLNDLFKGKERYKNCQVISLCWSIDKDSEESLERNKLFDNHKFYAHIIHTQSKGKYFLGIIFSTDNKPKCAESVSRFELDQCKRLSKSDFRTEIRKINLIEADKLWHELNY